MFEVSAELLALCRAVTAKRPKTVIDHILAHGFITTEALKDVYGYNHPPRAVRDVRENGIPVETFRVTGSDGRKIAAYRFGDLSGVAVRKLSGRTGLSKRLKDALIAKYGCQCFIYLEVMDERDLQIDHRVPYEVGGDGDGALSTDDFMLLSASANRAKSWSCEHCDNWNGSKDKQVCLTCYWAFPENYSHVATCHMRRIDLVWQGDEVAVYEKLKAAAHELGKEVPEFVKEVLEREAKLLG
ncbi:MAG: hypothetical protein RL122_429 [Pseudomonadota bacterium]|jgi:hypothetical protein|uniref:HNH endonuclease n=1 Tax=Thiothrix fructosivorans TaxID=111770 RepID=A0A8B0SSV8_9GAMM|nr:HNH endonuclease [Thiothrix fructosivorans]MBO0612258.1 HNH endonuclease [Thiothrix fructosivorans]QTX12767.1 HNH endonuclease [Thiothrix fructosivorans]